MAEPWGRDGERRLIARCRDGEEKAFEELIERFATLVLTLIERVVGERGRAESLAQDVFLRVYEGMPYFRGEARLATWILRTAVTTCLEAVRDGTPVGDKGDPLARAMAKLPVGDRLLIATHGLQEVDDEEVVAALRLPPGSVESHRRQARRQLRRLLEPDR